MYGLSILFVIFLYVWLAKWLTRMFMRLPETKKNKRIVQVVCIFIAVLIPFWDIPLIHLHFNHLCKTESGIHVYEEMVLGPEYWLKSEFILYPNEFKVVSKNEYHISSITQTSRWRKKIVRLKDNKVLGELITINKGRGWIRRLSGISFFPKGKTLCYAPNGVRAPTIKDLTKAIFKQSGTASE